MNTLFETYLNGKKKRREKIKVYLKATQNIPDKNNRGEIKTNNLMLSGLVADFDEKSLLLEDKECFVPFTSILSIKPDGYDR